MKRMLLIILTVFICCSGVMAQEEVSSEGGRAGIRLGLNGQAQPALGPLADYVVLGVGGGFSAEFDLPFDLGENIKIGVPVRMAFFADILKIDTLKTMMVGQVNSGVYVRFLLLDNTFVIQPELNYGLSLTIPVLSLDCSGELKSVYADQAIQTAVGFRYAPSINGDNILEFEIAPVYTLCVENGALVHYLGGRLGVYFKLM